MKSPFASLELGCSFQPESGYVLTVLLKSRAGGGSGFRNFLLYGKNLCKGIHRLLPRHSKSLFQQAAASQMDNRVAEWFS